MVKWHKCTILLFFFTCVLLMPICAEESDDDLTVADESALVDEETPFDESNLTDEVLPAEDPQIADEPKVVPAPVVVPNNPPLAPEPNVTDESKVADAPSPNSEQGLIAAIKSFFGSWYQGLDVSKGWMASAKMEGWNLWHTYDASYFYADAIGSKFSPLFLGGNMEADKLYDFAMFGGGVRVLFSSLPYFSSRTSQFPWKIIMLDATVTAARASLGGGIVFPIPIGTSFCITPWGLLNLIFITNKSITLPAFEFGLDIGYKEYVIGLHYYASETEAWKSIGYGISAGYKFKL